MVRCPRLWNSYEKRLKEPKGGSLRSEKINTQFKLNLSVLNLKCDNVAFNAILFYWTRIYPMVLINLSPLSGDASAAFPHVLLSSGCPLVPNPILESQPVQVL